MWGPLRKVLNRRLPLKFFIIGQLAWVFLIFLSFKTSPLIKWDTSKLALRTSKNQDNYSLSNVKIGIVVCTGGKLNMTENTGPVETYTLVKSAIISSLLYSQVSELEFHIFVDSGEVTTYLKSGIDRMVAASSKQSKEMVIKYTIYNIFESSLSAENVNKFVKRERPGAFLRIFFPELLPSIDKILYLDTDVVITGNIAEIWRSFLNYDKRVLVALSRNNEMEDGNHLAVDFFNFADIPHVTPKGVNSGVMYMNLEGMRETDWTNKLLMVNEKYAPVIKMRDQKLLNMAFKFNPGAIELLPCHYNFQYLHCDKGLTCKDGLNDSTGIHIFHGTGGSFMQPWLSHHHIFTAYGTFNLAWKEGLLEGLLKPLKRHYTEVINSTTCHGVLGPMLFKDLID